MLTNSHAVTGLATPRSAVPIQLLDRAIGSGVFDGRTAFRRDDLSRLPVDPKSNARGVRITWSENVLRSPLAWDDAAAEIVHISGADRIDIGFRAPVHLLILHDKGSRVGGETVIEDTATSTLKDFAQRLTFVPAGHEYRESIEPRSPVRIVYFYFDPSRLASSGVTSEALHPRLFFEDESIAVSMRKLQASLEQPLDRNPDYLAALGMLLIHEVGRIGQGPAPKIHYGGLAPWQQRAIQAHIEEHLDGSIRLATLAGLARLSTYHFCRAFKQTFGVSPMRYHTRRRIERAKDLLAARKESVTEIGLTIGYSETSSFTAAFRKLTGMTPSAYRRNLG